MAGVPAEPPPVTPAGQRPGLPAQRPQQRVLALRAAAWAGLALLGAGLVWHGLAHPIGAVLVRPGMLIGLVALAIGALNAIGCLALRAYSVPPDPGGRLWA